MFQLEKPIVFFDLESTGVDVATARIVEISCLKLHTDGREEVVTQRVNPLVPIPEEAAAVHGIRNDDVIGCPTFAQIAAGVQAFFMGCDIGGFNSTRYDVPLLVEEFLRCGIDLDLSTTNMVDSQIIFHKNEPRDLVSALSFYCNQTLEGAYAA